MYRGFDLLTHAYLLASVIGWFTYDVREPNPFSLTVPIYRYIAEGAAL